MPPLPPPALLWETAREILLPAMGVSAVLFFLCLRLLGPRAGFIASALAVAAGFATANAIRGSVAFSNDNQGLHRLLWMAAAVLPIGMLARVAPAWLGEILRAGGAGLAAWVLVPMTSEEESLPRWLPWAFAAVVLASWVVAEQASRRPAGGAGAWSFALAGVAASLVLLHASFARGADLALMLAGAMTGVALVGGLLGGDTGGAVPAGAVLLPGLLFFGNTETFSEVPLASWLLVALSPLALALTLMPFLERFAGARLFLLRTVLVLAPIVPAIVLTMKAVPNVFEGLD
jgi:hypothetical protein